MKKLPGIFNDVLGPEMRGPSSSHTAASWRIARTAVDILNDDLVHALIEFDKNGAWALNYREQGTKMGMDGGLLGLSITDERIKDTDSYADQKGIAIDYRISSFPTSHANTIRLTLWGASKKEVQIIAVSTGGGAFRIESINGFDVIMNGDLFEVIFFAPENIMDLKEINITDASEINCSVIQGDKQNLFELKSSLTFSPEFLTNLQNNAKLVDISVIHPVMPVIAGNEKEMPFTSIQSLYEYAEKTNSDLGKLGLIYEMCISGMPEKDMNSKMESVMNTIQNSINIGLRGTEYRDRILHQQSHLIRKAEKEGKIKESIVNRMIAYVTALMESKSAMEVIVATPTAGACGTLGGSLRAVAEELDSDQDDLIKAYFASGIVGAYFAQGPGFSAEEHGCQVETGAAAGMAAAGIVQLMGGTAKQAIDAASMAIQNVIGLVCDPVADRVEVPCLGKNITAAVNAYSSAIMAISGFDAVIPLDQAIQTVIRVSKTMPTCVKCTGKGGLAITEASIELKRRLEGQSG